MLLNVKILLKIHKGGIMKKNSLLVKVIPTACLAVFLLSTIIFMNINSETQKKATLDAGQTIEERNEDTHYQPTNKLDNNLVSLTSEKEQYQPTIKIEDGQQAELKPEQVKSMTKRNLSQDETTGIQSISQSSVSSSPSLEGYDPAKITPVTNVDELQSEHPYKNNYDHMWVYQNTEAQVLKITFDTQTQVESKYDYIYLYNSNNICIGTYTGNELSDKTITVWDDTIMIRLCSDSRYTYYGFKVSNIIPIPEYKEYTLLSEELPQYWYPGDTNHQTLKLEKKYIVDGVIKTSELTENIRFAWKPNSALDEERMDADIEGNNLTLIAQKDGSVSGYIEAYEGNSTTPVAVSKMYNLVIRPLVENESTQYTHIVLLNEICKTDVDYVYLKGVITNAIINNVVSSDPSVVSIEKTGAISGRSFKVKGESIGKAEITVYYSVKYGEKVINASCTYNFVCNEVAYQCGVKDSGIKLQELCPTQTSEVNFELEKKYGDITSHIRKTQDVDPSQFTIEVYLSDRDRPLVETRIEQGKVFVKALSPGSGTLNFVIKIDGQEVYKESKMFSIASERYVLGYYGPTTVYKNQIIKGPDLIHYMYEEGTLRQQVIEDAVITCNANNILTYQDGNVIVKNTKYSGDTVIFKCIYNNVTYYKQDYIEVSRHYITSSENMYVGDNIKMSLDSLPTIDHDYSIIWSVENEDGTTEERASIQDKDDGTATLTCLKQGRIVVSASYKIGDKVFWTVNNSYTIEKNYSGMLKSNITTIGVNDRRAIIAYDFRKNNTYYGTNITSVKSSDSSTVDIENYTKTKNVECNYFRINLIGVNEGKADIIINYIYYDEEGRPVQGTETVNVTVDGPRYTCEWEKNLDYTVAGGSIPLSFIVYKYGYDTNGDYYYKQVDMSKVKVEYQNSDSSIATVDNDILTFNNDAKAGDMVYITPYITVDDKKYQLLMRPFGVSSNFIDLNVATDNIVYVKEGETKILNAEIYQYNKDNVSGRLLDLDNTRFSWKDNQSGLYKETLTSSYFSTNGRSITGIKMGTEKVTVSAATHPDENTLQYVSKEITVRVVPKAIPVLEVGQKEIVTNPYQYFSMSPGKTGAYKIACSDEYHYPLIELFDQDWNKIASYKYQDSEYADFFYVNVNLEEGKNYFVCASSSEQSSWPSYTMLIEPRIVTTGINNCDIQLSTQQFTYNGKEQKPVITIKDGDYTLKEDTDYLIVKNVNMTSPGRYILTIQGIGQYSGCVKKTCMIKPISLTDTMVQPYEFQVVFNGMEQKPDLVLKNDKVTLKKGTDYEVFYNGDFTSKGTYTMTVCGTGNYTDVLTKSFDIKDKLDITKCTVELSKDSIIYSESEEKPIVTVKSATTVLAADTDFEVVYPDDMTQIGTYEITIHGTGIYEGTVTKEFTINPYNISGCGVELSEDSKFYSGSEEKPEITVTHGDTVLTEDTDYKVEYPDDITNIGTYTITINGINNYEGTVTKEFTIIPLDFTESVVELSEDSIFYSGAEEKPTITVTHGGTELTEGTDYEIVYPNEMTNIGTYIITINGINHYEGTVTKEFTIKPLDFTESVVELSDESMSYTGKEEKPTITVTHGGIVLTEGTDYEIIYPNEMTNAGTYEITVTGIGIYRGAVTKEFTIKPLAITESIFELSEESICYTGKEEKPTITVTHTGIVLTEGTDYKIIYPNEMTNAGTYEIIINGIGNYGGTVDKNYTIKPYDLKHCVVKLSESIRYYSGIVKKPTVAVMKGNVKLEKGNYTIDYIGDFKTPGKHTIKVNGTGNYSGSLTTSYTINKASKELTFTKKSIQKKYGDKPFVNNLTASSIRTVTYTSSNTKVAKVDAKGAVTIIGGGKATITAVYVGNQIYNGTKASYTLSVAKIDNRITASNVKKTVSSKAQTFKLKVYTKGKAILSYISNNKAVKVKAGKVTIDKKFVGKAVITIKAASNNNYNAISKKITITVNPTGTKVTSLKNNKKNSFLLKWSKNTLVTGYEIQYATNKSFSKAIKKKITKAGTKSYQSSKLKNKRTYYVRIRTYKRVNGVSYYSGWSKVRKVKIK